MEVTEKRAGNAVRVLVVRHGKGRARLPGYLDAVFARLAGTSPTEFRRLRFHETGDPQPSLDDVGAVVFLLADPLRERYPACYDEALALASHARASGVRILNPPEALSHSIKSIQAGRWRAAGIPTPDTLRFESREQLALHAQRLGYPILIRGDELHAQQGIRICASVRELEAIPDAELRLPGAVSRLVDIRESVADNPGSVYGRLFHKKRLLVLGDRIRTKHVFFSNQPIVTSERCTFRRDYQSRWFARFDPTLRACVHEDLAYWRRGTEHAEVMHQAMDALDLDFAAIDYSSRSDGGVILWEANPYPYLPNRADMMLPRWRWGAERVASYYDAVGRFLAGALDTAPRPHRIGVGQVRS